MLNSASVSAWLRRSASGSVTQKLLFLANLALVASSIVLIVLLATLAAQDKPTTQAIPRATATTTDLRWNWFNSVSSKAAVDVGVEDLSKLADASVNAKLLGVTISERTSLATLTFNGRPEQVYRVGDKLGSAVVIKQIQPFRIVVEQNGARRQILLQKADSVMQTEQSEDSFDQASGGQGAGDEGFAMANMFGAVPVQVDNYGSGFKLNKLSDEMKSLADIEDGDVVVDIGGTGIQELMSDPAQWVNYTNESSLPVTVIRNGEEVVIYVNAASLSAKMLPKLGLNN